MRSCEDVDETALSYAEIKALCAGDPRIREKMELDNDVARLRMLKSEYSSQHYRLEDSLLKHYPLQIASTTEKIAGITKDIATYTVQKEKCEMVTMKDGAANFSTKFPEMTIDGVKYTDKQAAGEALLNAAKGAGRADGLKIGEYLGLAMSVSFSTFDSRYYVKLKGKMSYECPLGSDVFGNITRINHALDNLGNRLDAQTAQLENLNNQVTAAKEELAKPFTQEEELQAK
jgi:hypothetical protein